MVHNKETAYIIRGGQGGIIIAFFLILMNISVHVNNFWRVASKDFIVFYLFVVILLAVVGGIAGKKYLKNKSTKLIWLIAYIIIYISDIFQEIAELKINKETFAIFILFAIFVVLYTEMTNYIWKLWIKGIDSKYSQ